jgi:hypothetical protein
LYALCGAVFVHPGRVLLAWVNAFGYSGRVLLAWVNAFGYSGRVIFELGWVKRANALPCAA